MTEYVSLVHHGLSYLVPMSQVVAAERGEPGLDRLELGPERTADPSARSVDAAPRELVVRTAAGRRSLRCRDIAVTAVGDGDLWALPPLTQELIGLPQVTGVAQIGERLHWVLNLEHAAAPPAVTEATHATR